MYTRSRGGFCTGVVRVGSCLRPLRAASLRRYVGQRRAYPDDLVSGPEVRGHEAHVAPPRARGALRRVCVLRLHGDFNVYGCFFVRLFQTGFSFQANIVEEYVLLSASLHISVGLVRTWDQKLSTGLMSGHLNLAITGSMLLTVITIHLFQSHFEDAEPLVLRPPPTLVNWHQSWSITLQFFWSDKTHVSLVPVRDIFLNECKVLENLVWCGLYIVAVVISVTHAAEFDMTHPPDVVEK